MSRDEKRDERRDEQTDGAQAERRDRHQGSSGGSAKTAQSGTGDLELELTEEVERMLSRSDLGEIRLDREGHWSHEGEPFLNQKLIDLFNHSVRPVQGGGFVIQVGKEIYPITVEDTAYFVRAIDITKNPPVIDLSDGSSEPLESATVVYDDRGGLYCRVKEGRYRAKFRRNVWHSLLDRMVEREDGIYLDLGETSIRLGDLDPEGD